MRTTATASAILRPDEIAALFVGPTLAISVAAQVATIVHTASHSFRIPRVTSDPTANWTAEGDAIVPSDLSVDEVTITPSKLAALSVISNELRDDSSPAAAEAIGAGMARDTARRLDEAFLGSLAAPAPPGLGSLSGVQVASGDLDSLDVLAEAISKAEQVGALVSHFITNPSTALALSTAKVGTGSNQPLLGTDATSATDRRALGVPILTSPYCAANVIWAVDKSRTYLVLRSDVTIETDGSFYFDSDRTAVRSIMRVGFGFPHSASVVKVTVT